MNIGDTFVHNGVTYTVSEVVSATRAAMEAIIDNR